MDASARLEHLDPICSLARRQFRGTRYCAPQEHGFEPDQYARRGIRFFGGMLEEDMEVS